VQSFKFNRLIIQGQTFDHVYLVAPLTHCCEEAQRVKSWRKAAIEVRPYTARYSSYAKQNFAGIDAAVLADYAIVSLLKNTRDALKAETWCHPQNWKYTTTEIQLHIQKIFHSARTCGFGDMWTGKQTGLIIILQTCCRGDEVIIVTYYKKRSAAEERLFAMV